jgi:hypothetical protein
MRSFLRRGQLAFLFFVAIQFGGAVSQAQSPKNLILFIPDGLRRGSVTPMIVRCSPASVTRESTSLTAIPYFRL